MIYRIGFSIILLGVLLYVVSHAVDINELWQTLATFPIHQFILLFAISSFIFLLKTWRFALLLKNSQIELTRWEAIRVYVAGLATSPLPAGEATRGVLVHHETGTKISKTTGSIVTQAYLELFASALIALVGSFFFKMIELPATLAFAILLIVALLLSSRRLVEFIFKILPDKKFLLKLSRRLRLIQKDVRDNLLDDDTHLPDKVFTSTLGISLITNVVGGILIMLIANNFGVQLNVIESLFIYSAAMLIQGFSISPGGLGFTEGGMVGLLLLFQVDFTIAVSIVIIFRLVTFIYSTLLGTTFLAVFYGKSLIQGRMILNKGAKA